MFGAKFAGNGFLVVGLVLLLPALASFTVGQSAIRADCRRYCWVFDIASHLFGTTVAVYLSGVLWLLLAALFVAIGIQLKRRKGRENAV
jgi:hypothetical protein